MGVGRVQRSERRLRERYDRDVAVGSLYGPRRRHILLFVAAFLAAAATADATAVRDGSSPAPAQIARLLTKVPDRTLNRVRAGGIPGPTVTKLHGARRMSHGKPELLVSSIAWCPRCAANSGALAVALERFGTLTGLRVVNTGTYYCTTLRASPCYPHSHGLSFLTERFRSRYLSFTDVVLQSVSGRPVESLTADQSRAISSFTPPVIPAIDVGGVYGLLDAGYSPAALAGKSWLPIARSLPAGSGPTGRPIDGTANLLTAALCKATHGHPAAVCSSPRVPTAARRL